MKTANIIILAGQSNAVGVGHTVYLPRHFSAEKVAELEAGYPLVKILYFSHDIKSEGFVSTKLGCTERSKQTLGPEVGMAEWISARFPGEEFFIIKCAVGGTSMVRDWLSPSGGEAYDPSACAGSPEVAVHHVNNGLPMPAGWCYNELVKLTREGLSMLAAEGYSPVIRGFCWMQGEADACDAGLTRDYSARFDGLVKDLTANFREEMAHCTFVDAGISEIWPLYREMNQCKAEYAAAHDGFVYLDTIAHGLTTLHEPEGAVDTYHYDSGSVVELGRLFAEKVTAGWC